jgi:hypothetical protein
MGGAFLGGWPTDRFGARRLLVASTFLRGVSLALIPLLWLTGRLTLAAAMAAYTLDAVVRGFTDTSAHALPLELGGRDRAALDRLNSRYEFVFDLGAAAGPAGLALVMISKKGSAPTLAPHVLVPIGFVLAALVFLAIPRRARPEALRPRPERPGGAPGGPLQGLRAVLSDRALLVAAGGVAILNLYPLRKLLAAFFAKAILSRPETAGWVGAAFGVGGALGALLYARRGGRGGAAWVAAGGVGVLALAVGWAPASLWPMLAASFIFAFSNVGARLALTRRAQERTPAGLIGGVTAVARFGADGVSVLAKSLVGAAFALGAGPRAAFTAVGAGLGILALVQFAMARSMARTARAQ